jgi:hypothetical protein
MLAAAIVNAGIREAVITPRWGETCAHAISSITLSGAILAIVYFAFGMVGVREDHDLFRMGMWWLTLTVAFEFLAGHYLFGNPWQKILADYNVIEGRLWSLVLVSMFISPFVADKLR